MLNLCVNYDFLFTGDGIFRMFVFEAEAVSHFFALFWCLSLRTPQRGTGG